MALVRPLPGHYPPALPAIEDYPPALPAIEDYSQAPVGVATGATSIPREAVRSGLIDALSVIAGILPFGLVIGVAVAESSVNNVAGWAGSFLILAGSAHLAAVTLLSSGAGAATVLLTVLVINARLLVYSASLGPHFRRQPAWFRRVAPFFVVDQIFALTWKRLDTDVTAQWIRWYYLALALAVSVVWILAIAGGVLAGPVIPQSWELSFATPALMIALLAPSLINRPAWIAASVGAAVAVLMIGMPNGLNLLLGAAAGTAAGIAAERIAR